MPANGVTEALQPSSPVVSNMGAECAGVHTISPLAVCLGEARTWHSWAQGQPAAT